MQSARHEKLVALVNEKGMLSTGELCGLLCVSQATVRRDITELDRQNRIRKTHGGAMAHIRHATEDMPMPMRRHTRREEKARIAAAALELLDQALQGFIASREREGAKLAAVIGDRAAAIAIAKELGCATELAGARRLVAANGAVAQRAVAHERGARGLAGWLADRYADGVAPADAAAPAEPVAAAR